MSVEWGSVTGTHRRIIIACSGPSALGVRMDLLLSAFKIGVHIIAVNQAIKWVPRANSWFTLDPDKRVRPLLEFRRRRVVYYAAVPEDYGEPTAKLRRHRMMPFKGITYLKRVSDGRSAKFGLSDDPTMIHTGNSAYGALGLAYLFKASEIVLIGVDATCEPYAFSEGTPNQRLDLILPELFASAVPQLENRSVRVINGSPSSLVTCFERSDPNDAIQTLL